MLSLIHIYIWEAIYSLRVRGAPAIGVTGGYAYYILADQIETEDKQEFVRKCTEMMEYINSSRLSLIHIFSHMKTKAKLKQLRELPPLMIKMQHLL